MFTILLELCSCFVVLKVACRIRVKKSSRVRHTQTPKDTENNAGLAVGIAEAIKLRHGQSRYTETVRKKDTTSKGWVVDRILGHHTTLVYHKRPGTRTGGTAYRVFFRGGTEMHWVRSEHISKDGEAWDKYFSTKPKATLTRVGKSGKQYK